MFYSFKSALKVLIAKSQVNGEKDWEIYQER